MPTLFLKILLSSFMLSIASTGTTLECNHFYSEALENEGIISSYNFPFKYQHNLTCHYTFYFKIRDISRSAKICFEFKEFDLEPGVPFCVFDYLEFQNSYPIVKYCTKGIWQYGTYDKEYPYSSLEDGYKCWPSLNSNKFVLKFSTDNSTNGKGFQAFYKIIENSQPDPMSNYVKKKDDDREKPLSYLIKCSFSWPSYDGDDDDGRCTGNMDGWKKTDDLFVGATLIDDHTIGSGGSFLLSSKNVKSLLVINEITLNFDLKYCLTFFYFFESSLSPGLKVFVTRDQMVPEWEARPSNATPGWRLAEINLSGLNSVSIAIATNLSDFYQRIVGVVALDDLTLNIGSCSGADVSCNFESSNCDWSSIRELGHSGGMLLANGSWGRQSMGGASERDDDDDARGSFITTLTPPHDDDDLITRHLLISPQVTSAFSTWDLNSRDGSSDRSGNSSSTDYVSGRATKNNFSDYGHHHACFKFLHRFGKNGGLSRLNLRLVRHDNLLTLPVWYSTNHVRGNWVNAMADLVLSRDVPFKIIFEALLRPGSDVSLDELFLESGSCITPTSECLSTNGMLCGTGLCIDSSHICDGKKDCEDGSDEDETIDCHERRLISTTTSIVYDDWISNPSMTSKATYSSHDDNINIMAAWLSSTIVGVLVLICLVMVVICLARKKKSIKKSEENIVGPQKLNQEDVTIYQTLSITNQSSSDLRWIDAEERGLRPIRCSSSSDDGSDVAIMNINEAKNQSSAVRRADKRFDSCVRSNFPLQYSVRSSRREPSGTESDRVFDSQTIRGQTSAPLIVTSKYIISPDKVGAFVPRTCDRQNIERMIESYNKDIKIPNNNTLHDRSLEASKQFGTTQDRSSCTSEHVYEDIDETKIMAGVQFPMKSRIDESQRRLPEDVFQRSMSQEVLEKSSPAIHFNRLNDRGRKDNNKSDASIISKAILV